jgi:hypothetical protein
MRMSEQTTNLITALVAARAAFRPVTKDAIATVGKDREFQYADLAAILDAVIPALCANALVLLQSIDAESSSLITRLTHTSGEWVESVYPLKLEQTPQAFGSALTYGRRYSILSLLCLAAEDDDGAKAEKARPPAKAKTEDAPKEITNVQRKRMFDIAHAGGWSDEQIRSYLIRNGISGTTAHIRADEFPRLCNVFTLPPADPQEATP